MQTKQLEGELIKLFRDQASWERWLKKYSRKQSGVWLRFAKPKSAFVSLSYPEAVAAAQIFDWHAGERKAESEQTWLRRFCPHTRYDHGAATISLDSA